MQDSARLYMCKKPSRVDQALWVANF